MTWVAYVDESMRAQRDGFDGYYVLAAAVIEDSEVASARLDVLALALRGGLPFHWRLEQEPRRAKAISIVASLPVLHLVVVGTPLTPAKQERGRRLCLATMLAELDNSGVEQVWMESRRPKDNLRDLQAVNAFRRQKTISDAIRVKHALPAGPQREPMLWIPDVVAGVITSNDQEHRALLQPVLTELHIRLR